MASVLSGGMDCGASFAAAARHSVFCNAADDPAGARDGALSFLPLLRGAGYAAIFYSGADSDWNAGRGDSHQGADPVAGRAVRYRNCGTDCWICGCTGNACGRDEPFETDGAGHGIVRVATGISCNFLCHARFAPRRGGEHACNGAAFEPGLSASDGGGGVGGNVCDGAEPVAQQPAGWRTHCVRAVAARAPRDFVAHGDCAGVPGSRLRRMVGLGGAAGWDERAHFPATAGAGVSAASGEPVAFGGAGTGDAVVDVYGFAVPGQLVIVSWG